MLNKKFIISIFLCGLIFLTLSSAIVYSQFNRLLAANALVLHTYQVIDKLNNTFISVIDSQRLQSLFANNKEKIFLNKYSQNIESIFKDLSDIRILTRDNPEQQIRLNKVAALIRDEVENSQELMKYAAGSRGSKNIPLQPSVQTEMFHHIELIKSAISEMISIESSLLQQRSLFANDNKTKSSLFILSIIVASNLILLFAFYALNYYLKQQQREEEKRIESEKRLQRIIESTTDLIAAIDVNYNYITFNNPFIKKFRQVYGKDLVEGKNIAELLENFPEEKEETFTLWQRALNGEEFSVVKAWGKNDKEMNYYEITFSTIREKNIILGAVQVMHDITHKRQEELQLIQSNEKLNLGMNELKKRYDEIALLNDMSEALQSCLTMEEAYVPITTFCRRILPSFSKGILYIMHPSRNYLEVVVSWGGEAAVKVFSPEHCWGLRRTQIHEVNHPAESIICTHVNNQKTDIYPHVCIPLMAHNDTLGLLYLEQTHCEISDLDNQILREHKHLLMVTTAEQIALALANIRLRETLRYLSIRDPLTGLYNRRYLEETLLREFNRGERDNLSLAILMIDIDHFKRFNDSHGHEAGDLILKKVAHTFQEFSRGSDLVCRYGGEEFIIFLGNISSADALLRAESLREKIHHITLDYGAQKISSISISIGLALYPQDGLLPQTLIEAADKALYVAKNSGRDRVVLASSL